MRQAGRYLPEYRALRAQVNGFLGLCKNPELAATVTLQPIERFGLDAAILFSDILVVPEAMGQNLTFLEGEGPVLDPPLRHPADLAKLRPLDPETGLDYVMTTIRLLRSTLPDHIPLIGFSGSPWTLATYMVEGGTSKTFGHVKGMLYAAPEQMEQLLDRLADAVAAYFNAQIRHGVQAVQIFDTWGGILEPEVFRHFSLRSMQRIVDQLDRTGPDGQRIPVILFAKGCGPLLEELAATGCDVLGLDWNTPIGAARTRVGARVALQGNLDPAVLYAPPEVIQNQVRVLLEAFGAHPGHVFNLGHGIAPDVDPECVTTLVAAVRAESTRIHTSQQ
jgi:uroporphyrinogen decarboxylase